MTTIAEGQGDKFGHLDKYQVKPDMSVWYTFLQIEGEPRVRIAPATEANKPFFNETLRRQRKNLRAIQSNQVTSGLLDETRDEDRLLFARFVLLDWRRVVDSKGQEVPFNQDNALGFLEALPNWLFDDLRQYAGNPANFVGMAADPGAAEDLAGNSSGG